ncbi:MAG: hypothetical protein J5I41_05330 [Saprospiraceae bacterium]|nr:hypothetical protein [Saprospiraceae bacterium]
MMAKAAWMLIGVVLAVACERTGLVTEPEDVLLAEVFQKKLYLGDVRNMLHEDASPQDSTRIVNAYVARWVRDQLLLAKAEENVPKDLNIDKLVADYRASLVLHLYERRLMETQLDSSVNEAELIDFYEANKEQYLLEKPIARILFLKLRADSPNLRQALGWWNQPSDDNMRKLRHYARRHAAEALLQDTVWMRLDEIVQLVSPKVINESSLEPGKEVRYQDGDYHYLLKVEEARSTLEVAPMAYIRDQATRAILLQRQVALLESVKDRLFEAEIRKNNVKIHTQ